MSFLSVHEISAGYGKQTILEKISFQLESGCLMGIIGANGSGKTTLLKALCGILPHTGTCTLDHTVLEHLSARQIAKLVSYVPPYSGISIDISALDFVLMGFNPYLGLLDHPTKSMKNTALHALEKVGLSDKTQSSYLHLSEGQKHLCLLARTLVAESKLLMLDEPESALDFQHRYQMLSLLRDWIDSDKGSAIVTLHDPSLALNYCDRLLLLKDGEILDMIEPRVTSLDKMELSLRAIYGSISLQRCYNKKGEAQLVILRENDI